MRTLLLTCLMGCSTPIVMPLSVPAAADSEVVVSLADVDLDRMMEDLDYGIATLEFMASNVESLSAAERAPLAAAARELNVNCAYNRSAFLVPLAVERELAQIDLSAVNPKSRRAIVQFKRGISAQARLIRALDADDLTLPKSTDYLSKAHADLVDGEAFAASPDPTDAAHRLVALIPDLVAEMPPETIDRLDAARAVLEVHLGHQQIRSRAFHLWLKTATELTPGVRNDASRLHMSRVEALLDAIRGNSC